MSAGKIENYLGFAKKSNSILFGFDAIKSSKKRIYCVIIGCDILEKLETKVRNICKQRKIPIKKLKSSLDDLLHTSNCKVISIINKNFVGPILESEE